MCTALANLQPATGCRPLIAQPGLAHDVQVAVVLHWAPSRRRFDVLRDRANRRTLQHEVTTCVYRLVARGVGGTLNRVEPATALNPVNAPALSAHSPGSGFSYVGAPPVATWMSLAR